MRTRGLSLIAECIHTNASLPLAGACPRNDPAPVVSCHGFDRQHKNSDVMVDIVPSCLCSTNKIDFSSFSLSRWGPNRPFCRGSVQNSFVVSSKKLHFQGIRAGMCLKRARRTYCKISEQLPCCLFFIRRPELFVFRWDTSVICPIVALKPAVTVFTGSYFRTLRPNWLKFYSVIWQSSGLWPKKTKASETGSYLKLLCLYRKQLFSGFTVS